MFREERRLPRQVRGLLPAPGAQAVVPEFVQPHMEEGAGEDAGHLPQVGQEEFIEAGMGGAVGIPHPPAEAPLHLPLHFRQGGQLGEFQELPHMAQGGHAGNHLQPQPPGMIHQPPQLIFRIALAVRWIGE